MLLKHKELMPFKSRSSRRCAGIAVTVSVMLVTYYYLIQNLQSPSLDSVQPIVPEFQESMSDSYPSPNLLSKRPTETHTTLTTGHTPNDFDDYPESPTFHMQKPLSTDSSIIYEDESETSKMLFVHGSNVGNALMYGDPFFGYIGHHRGNVSPSPTYSPEASINPQKRKRGLLAMAVSGHFKERGASIVQRFQNEDMDVMLFHYDDIDWNDVPVAANTTSITFIGQTKFWFAKRFLTPEVVENYDYLFLWNNNIVLPEDWSPSRFISILQKYNIHAAQPAIHSGSHPDSPQHQTVSLHSEVVKAGNPGRFSEFVEIVVPVFSREAWQNCIWETIPYDGFSFWGVDNIWYPHCASQGYCRFAIIDVMSVGLLNITPLYRNIGDNIREMEEYVSMYQRGICHARRSEMDWISYVRSLRICHYVHEYPLGRSFRSVKTIDPRKHGGPENGAKCIEPDLWPGVDNISWDGIRLHT